MGERLERIILNNAPTNWKDGNGTVLMNQESSEFREVTADLLEACPNAHISKIERHEHLFDYGQFLFREQHLLHLNPNQTFYRVRRFVKINSCYLNNALKHNLDYRRCGMVNLQLLKKIPNIFKGDIVLIVQTLTADLIASNITPERSSDYFIEYIVYF